MKAKIYSSNNVVRINFKIPASLSQILLSGELNKDEKINLVKTYTDTVRDENGDQLEQIPNQHAVALIMALELEAL